MLYVGLFYICNIFRYFFHASIASMLHLFQFVGLAATPPVDFLRCYIPYGPVLVEDVYAAYASIHFN